MSSNRVISLIAILILLLAACAAGGEEPAAPETEQTSTPESGLATVPPTEEGNRVQEEEEMTMDDEQATASPGENDASSEDVIVPAEVDLSEVTPEAAVEGAGDGEAVEMPAPGRPKPQIAMINQAAQDLAERLGIEADDVSVGAVEEVQWSDSSLGCPAADGVYMQVITPGFRITLQVEGETYDYHTDRSDTVILCGPDGRPVP
ncbi:MAG: hypothetical protein R3248_07310 [Candidatus Promineifilaceae bacterium]|nr:hypothetical protein [Candidatus Promineifilaceae bacterium]